MNGENTASQIKIWGLIGPMSCLLAFFVIFTKGANTPIFLPLILLLGVPICWRFKLWGFAFCSIALLSFLFYKYSQIALDERFWFLGMGLAVAGALFVYALSNDEVEAIIDAQGLESKSRLENLWRVDERQKAQLEKLKKREEEVLELKLKVKSFQRLIEMSKHELTIAKENTEISLQKIDNAEGGGAVEQNLPTIEEKYQKLLKRFTENSDLLEETRKKLSFTKEKLSFVKNEYEEMNFVELSELESKLKNRLSVQFHKKIDVTDKIKILSKLKL